MKTKSKKILFAAILSLLCLVVFTACTIDPPGTVVVRFEGGEGSTLRGGEIEQILDKGATAAAPIFEREGYEFEGWEGSYHNVTSDITITAKWKKKVYTVTFDANGGEYVSGALTQQIEHGTAAIAPVFSKEGYSLKWDNAFNNVKSNLTVTAQWEIKRYTVFFDANGGAWQSGGSPVQIVEHGDNVIAPVFIKHGFNFVPFDEDDLENITEDKTLVAEWTPANCTVTFDANGGKFEDDSTTKGFTVAYGASATAPSVNPTRTGYEFIGWDRALTNIDSNLTIKAVWQINTYQVIFDGDGGTWVAGGATTQTVEYGKGAIEPYFQRTGYTFNGWDRDFNSITGAITVKLNGQSRPLPLPLNLTTYRLKRKR